MTEPTRWVVIDDKDSRIRYSSGWSSVGGDQYNNQGNFGATYRNSLHGTATDGADFSFSFRGNAARIKGTTHLQIDSAGVPNPDWDCILDGRVVRRADPFPYVENNWVFCEFDNIPGGDHTIGLKVKTKERSFWLDYIEYRPTGTVDNEVVWASRDDADLSFSKGWVALGSVGHNTMIRGSSATFRFIGTGVSLYAMFPTELPHNEGQATYSIDGGPTATFTIPGGGDISVYNRKIFEVTGLSKRDHTIEITYTSASRSTPLVISQLFIEGGTNQRAPAPGSGAGGGSPGGGITGGGSTSTTATSDPNASTILVVDPSTNTSAAAVGGTDLTSSSTTSATAANGNAAPSDVAGSPKDANSGNRGAAPDSAGSSVGGSSKSSTPVGAIVGGVLGAIVVILLLVLLMVYRRRKRIQLRNDIVWPPGSPFSMTREGHQNINLPPTPAMYSNAPASSMVVAPGSEPPVLHGSISHQTPPSMHASLNSMSANVSHPEARSKRGPTFNSPYISNHSPFDDPETNDMSSSAQLVPNRRGHQQNQSSIDQSVSAYSGYTSNTDSSRISSAPSRAVFHEDSGIRLPAQAGDGVVEYPPMYSAR